MKWFFNGFYSLNTSRNSFFVSSINIWKFENPEIEFFVGSINSFGKEHRLSSLESSFLFLVDLRPNLKNLSRGLNLSSNMVGSA